MKKTVSNKEVVAQFPLRELCVILLLKEVMQHLRLLELNYYEVIAYRLHFVERPQILYLYAPCFREFRGTRIIITFK